jgi:hypothetical protein
MHRMKLNLVVKMTTQSTNKSVKHIDLELLLMIQLHLHIKFKTNNVMIIQTTKMIY